MDLLGEVVKAVSAPESLSDASVVELVTTVVNVCAEVRPGRLQLGNMWGCVCVCVGGEHKGCVCVCVCGHRRSSLLLLIVDRTDPPIVPSFLLAPVKSLSSSQALSYVNCGVAYPFEVFAIPSQ